MATYYLCPFASFLQCLNDSGQVANGLLLWTYLAGTSTPQATYTDSTGGTPNSNPIQLNSAGRLPNVSIWQPGGVALKLQFSTNAGTVGSPVFGVQIGPTFDQVSGIDDPAAVLSTLANTASGSGADLVANAMRSYDIIASVRSANAPSLAAGQTLVISIQGGTTVGDSTGGIFYWNASSSATDDGVNVIKPNAVSGNGRYLRLVQIGVLGFTANLTGMTTTITGNITQETNVNLVTLYLTSGAITGTSNSTAFTINNLPAVSQPAKPTILPCILEDNGAVIGGWASISGSTITFGTGINNNASGFTNSGFKGLPAGWTLTYAKS